MKIILISLLLSILLLPFNLMGNMSNDLSGYYSNMTQETEYETYDCNGYTFKIEIILTDTLKVNFVSHEGNCNINGSLAEDIKYIPKDSSLSFKVPFRSNIGTSFYKFKGTIFNNKITGDLSIEYPEPKYNKSENIELLKQGDEFVNKFK